MTISAFQDYLNEHRDRLLADLVEACSIPSVSGQMDACEQMAAWVEARLQRLGASVTRWETEGGPPIIWGVLGEGSASILSYSHYDVQPADPLDLWQSPPFEPSVREGKLYARGVSDDKGDLMARIHAVEMYQALHGTLPLVFKFFVEGEEEVGSPHLAPVAQAHADELKSDGCLWEAGEVDEHGRYTMYLGVKGIQYLELRVRGADTDLHSAYAPMVINPAWRLVQALNTIKAPDDRITIDGFMEHVRPPTPAEEALVERIPFDGQALRSRWGLRSWLNDMDDREALRQFVFAPTCTICGLRSGFIDAGTKTVLPSQAFVKLDFRLVPDLTPELVVELLRAHLDRRGFHDIEIVPLSSLSSSKADPESPFVRKVIAVATEVYGHEPVVYPSHGGSGPMYPLASGLGMDSVTVGVGYTGSNLHAPNENIRLEDYFNNVLFLARLLQSYAGA
ncbi:MAG: M20/M25/M40 family metallo-hydrolase [Caldilineae bacterium]|nr:MAG: M20/M25/M40 family metallo-hydrolase [Caldilineae bacterium]